MLVQASIDQSLTVRFGRRIRERDERLHIGRLDPSLRWMVNEDSEDDQLEFTDVPLPLGPLESPNGFVRDRRNATIEPSRVPLEEMVHEPLDVSSALLEGRKREVQGSNPVEKILPKRAFPHGCREISTRRRQETDVGPHPTTRSDRSKESRLEDAKKLRLRGEREIGELVEQQDTCASALDEARTIGVGTGERAGHVTEEFRLEELGRQARTRDADERPGCARASPVNRSSDEFLARAGRAAHERRQVDGGDLLNRLEHPLHGRRSTDDSLERFASAAGQSGGRVRDGDRRETRLEGPELGKTGVPSQALSISSGCEPKQVVSRVHAAV